MKVSASLMERLLGRDGPSVALLFLLYTLQGIPMGLSGSVPFLLSGKISYKQQSLLSLVSLPFSLKLLWAPLVDALHSPRIGRRRSWLLPVQFLAGILMVWGGDPARILAWIGAMYFNRHVFPLSVDLCDIAVDGWALTMLSAENKGMASTCNTVGQTLGYFVSYVGFLALNDPQTCRRFLPAFLLGDSFADGSEPGALLDLAGFLRFWGWVIIATTVVVLLFFPEDYSTHGGERARRSSVSSAAAAKKGKGTSKRLPRAEAALSVGPIGAPGEEVHLFTDEILENGQDASASDAEHAGGSERAQAAGRTVRRRGACPEAKRESVSSTVSDPAEEGEPEGVLESYCLLWKLLFLPPVRTLLLLLLTCRIAFACVDAATQLKLIERGVKKEDLALFAPLFLPLGIICPMMVGRFLRGRFPLRLFSYGYLLRMCMCLVWAAAVAATGYLLAGDGAAKMSSSHWAALYSAMFLVTGAYNVCSDLMFVSQMAFFAQVSDPRIGGTYMTFLNTVTNLGVKWPNTLSLLLMDVVSIQDCSGGSSTLPSAAEGTEGDAPACRVVLDAYFVQVAVCFLAGAAWLSLCWRRIESLQQVPLSQWRVEISRPPKPSRREPGNEVEMKKVEM
ncbi:putative acetyl-CoA transporter [Neospora caninum Liverpool]|uniref:Acetyl-CoA transporter, putative n=1 Tax=Neospora caninum (strain Liverpool) TaxID=572307 RepID=F0VPE8_NEOCL|nr:putative acetyl-CoA transporter [Neospora caninum Liverpool]CBZ55594.1 putative acetyl-CoA transporter [Neospora caninum Liverpool]CEL70336.1 TPA: acetyl-CoA transporter, putative [Neospora caninum Liverpool]|eukprot:XP_003885622.1 putative acetyl-CoA transporter [Neospora caninum Liverpool]